MNMKRPSVFVTNVFPDGNKGGAAITCATIRAVKKAVPGCEVTLIAAQKVRSNFHDSHRYTFAEHPDVNAVMPVIYPGRAPFSGLWAVAKSLLLLASRRYRRTHRIADELSQADLVVSKGGYVFVERYTLRNLMSNWLTALPLIIASRSGVPTAAIGATVGPFKTWYSRALNGWILRNLDLVVPRDDYSYQTALAIGVSPDRVVMLPDLVFSHTGPSSDVQRDMAIRYGLDKHNVGIITIPKGSSDQQFLTALRDCLVRLVESKVIEEILIVIQSEEDLKLSQEYARYFPPGMARVIDDDLSPEQLMGLYAGAVFVIARRMHAAIFSLIAGVPTFAVVNYAKKVQGVMRSLGLEAYLVNYPDVDPNQLAERIVDAIADRDTTCAQINAAVANARDELTRLPSLLRHAAARRFTDGEDLLDTSSIRVRRGLIDEGASPVSSGSAIESSFPPPMNHPYRAGRHPE
jgi:colanic acid/amylovoran biosynthesis protein